MTRLKSYSKEMAGPGFNFSAPESVLLNSVLALPPSYSDFSLGPIGADNSGDVLLPWGMWPEIQHYKEQLLTYLTLPAHETEWWVLEKCTKLDLTKKKTKSEISHRSSKHLVPRVSTECSLTRGCLPRWEPLAAQADEMSECQTGPGEPVESQPLTGPAGLASSAEPDGTEWNWLSRRWTAAEIPYHTPVPPNPGLQSHVAGD